MILSGGEQFRLCLGLQIVLVSMTAFLNTFRAPLVPQNNGCYIFFKKDSKVNV